MNKTPSRNQGRVQNLVGIVTLTAVVFLGAQSLAEVPKPQQRIGRKLPNFTLRDYRGRPTALAEFSESKIVVIAFMGTECPLAKLYSTRLVKLHEYYGPRGVAFLGINANVQDSITEIAAHARKHEISFPVLKDVGNQVADFLGAVRTPEVFVLDAERVVRYWGRIDDQYGIGTVREAPRSNDLANALDELLAGKQVTTPVAEAVGCHIGRVPKPDENSDVTYSNQVSRILNRRCVECHREGQIAPFALTQYSEVAGWAEMIDEVVRQNRMPPWHASENHGTFSNDRSLTEQERSLLHRWVVAGAPKGDPARVPDPPTFTEGWQLPQKPNLVITMRNKAYTVPAEGKIEYQYFVVDPGFKSDKWVKGVEVLPGNRSVVHHIMVFAVKEMTTRYEERIDGYLGVYVPGMKPTMLPEGMAKLIPAGSKLLFQVHYTSVGTRQEDCSSMGLVLAEPGEVTHVVVSGSVSNRKFTIPAHAERHRVEAGSPLVRGEILLLSMMPHMHQRGKSFRFRARAASGKSKILLEVPNYDFNWQTSYCLSEPLRLPPGTQLRCTAYFDNSADNLSNPDPSVAVGFGPQTDDEMMFGYFDYALSKELFMRFKGKR